MLASADRQAKLGPSKGNHATMELSEEKQRVKSDS